MNKAPIFIVGVGRSGTTLIRQMLNSHSNIAIPYESHFITQYYDKRNDFGVLSLSDNRLRLIEEILSEDILKLWDVSFKASEVMEQLNDKSSISDVVEAIFKLYAHTHGKARWGDKSDYLDRMYKIRQMFPSCKFIHIIRDGRDVANSVMKMTWGPKNVKDAAEWWASHVKLGMCSGRMLPNDSYLEIRYEDLVLQSKETLIQVCQFLEEPFEENMLEFYKSSSKYIPQSLLNQHYNADSPPQNQRVCAWKNEMSDIDIAIFQDVASEMLSEYNYDIVKKPVSSILKKIRKLQLIIGKPFKRNA
ncbi:sulfotransferase [Colwellia sp. E2M01]|uniref:sulfotransferase family protein n=1 Tax=Colwellia sp. E2M01 TaxID=2841561 RepID=UPI001C0911F4|nr:sulfotransferase [Colwellia sp. E2M01]MBU2869091.1 sulfotransferase [Colwellia sp. E2M01]